MDKLPIAVLISGNGSNLQALIDACKEDSFPARIVMVLSNKPEAYGLTRAHNAGVPTHTLSHKNFLDRESFDRAMSGIIEESGAKLVCMAGFMRLLTPWFVERWHNRLVNIHPSLLPSFKGLHAQAQALEAGVKIAGCTVHFVRTEMDNGPIITQGSVAVLPDDTAESLTQRILTVEHQCYPEAVRLIASGQIEVVEEKVRFTV